MSTLQNFPMVSQKTTITSDGRPSEDALYECVAASIGAAILWYQKKAQWDQQINPDKLKDAAYGESYVGATSASAYVTFCKSLGFDLYPIGGSPGHLVDMAHHYLSEEKPVIFTEPDPYVSSSLGWSHVCVFYQDGDGYLVAMDPFIAQPVHRTNQEWLNLLQYNQIWILERLEDPMKIDINSPLVGNYFTESSPGWWTCKQTGKIVHGEILGFYQNNNGLTDLGLPVSNEIPMDPKNNTKQYFERGVLFFDPGHQYDNPPGSGRVYKAHLYAGPGQDPQIAELEAQLKQPAGVDPAKVANFQQQLELQAHKLVQDAQAFEAALIVPLA